MKSDDLPAQPDALVTPARKTWTKPTIVVASVADDTQDGYTTGTDDGNGNNDFTLS
jgi:hypothetical protein